MYRVLAFLTFSLIVTASSADARERFFWKKLETGSNHALCYEERATTFEVRGHDELVAALARVEMGDQILVHPGTYDKTYEVKSYGRRGSPIILKAVGDFPFTGTIDVYGNFVVVEGFRFENGRVRVRGHKNRITRNTFRHNTRTAIEVRDGGSWNRIDHNDIGHFRKAPGYYFGIRVTVRYGEPAPKRTIIDRNHIHDISGWRANGHEAIQIGSQTHAGLRHTQTLIYRNLLDNVDVDGEAISIKTSSNSIIGNTLLNSRAYFSSRGGRWNRWIGNYLSRTQGLRVLGKNPLVAGNVLNQDAMYILAGTTTHWDNVPHALANRHPKKNRVAAEDARIIDNQARKIYVGHEWDNEVPVLEAVFSDNDALIRLYNEEDTRFVPGKRYPGQRGRLLTVEEVGPDAPDRVCRIRGRR